MRSVRGTMNVYWPRFSAANDVPCSQCLTAEQHSSLASARTPSSHPAGGLQRPTAKFHWGMHFQRGRYRHFSAVICGRNCALMYGEILDPSLPYLGCKTFRGLAFRTGPPDRRTSRYAAALQQSWPVPLGPLGARATTLFKRNSTSCLIRTHAGILPWLRRSHGPTASCLRTRGGQSR